MAIRKTLPAILAMSAVNKEALFWGQVLKTSFFPEMLAKVVQFFLIGILTCTQHLDSTVQQLLPF